MHRQFDGGVYVDAGASPACKPTNVATLVNENVGDVIFSEYSMSVVPS